MYVLDSFAMLAFLDGEDGAERVAEILSQCATQNARACLSWISLGEVLYIVERERGLHTAQRILAAIEQLPLELLTASREAVLGAAHVKARFPLSYADAFVVAAAQQHGAVIVTGDPEFAAVESIVSVEWLLPSSTFPSG